MFGERFGGLDRFFAMRVRFFLSAP